MNTLIKAWAKVGAKYIASHAATSASVLQKLSKHKDVEVRIAVADNENTSTDTSMQLTQDDSADLRYAMAENHHIARRALDVLAADANPFVADRAQRTILRLKQVMPFLKSA